MAIKKHAVNPEDDLGFGTQAISQRVINRDGSINVKRIGMPLLSTTNAYNRLITMKWPKFWFIVLGGYSLANLFFASVYYAIGVEHLNGTEGKDSFHRFLDALFFSAQTLSTVGYGHISPSGIPTNSVAALESMTGLISFAVATGLLYGRFSRPSARIAYSSNILVAPYQLNNGRGLMFRMANERRNTLVDVKVELIFSYNEQTPDGKPARRFYSLPLERSNVSILTLSWTVVHPLDEKSPLFNATLEDLKNSRANFSVLVQAFDDTFSQTVHSRTSYDFDQVVWGARFTPAFFPDETGRVNLHLGKISDHTPVELSANA
ncbi:ion channel [Mucilaginibacter sp. RS28]|uniref:Ion channel n=1 Tax=Mucilaginibacter straminoryzae TaxID=2932774 RepID=A0A9X2BCM9_9SPHI|nr:ion channel [Mucilaginibacter straminoryzae]MCJ8211097.1 ion channel [Mucilaginibacter straminoryzae]